MPAVRLMRVDDGRSAHQCDALDHVGDTRNEGQRQCDTGQGETEANHENNPPLVSPVDRIEVLPWDEQRPQRNDLEEGLQLTHPIRRDNDATAQEKGAHRGDAELAHSDQDRHEPGQEPLPGQENETSQGQSLVSDGIDDAPEVGDLVP